MRTESFLHRYLPCVSGVEQLCLSVSYFQTSPLVSFLSVVFHIVHAPSTLTSTALACLACSSALLTSDWINVRLSFSTGSSVRHCKNPMASDSSYSDNAQELETVLCLDQTLSLTISCWYGFRPCLMNDFIFSIPLESTPVLSQQSSTLLPVKIAGAVSC